MVGAGPGDNGTGWRKETEETGAGGKMETRSGGTGGREGASLLAETGETGAGGKMEIEGGGIEEAGETEEARWRPGVEPRGDWRGLPSR